MLRFHSEFSMLSHFHRSSSGHGSKLKIVMAYGNWVIYESARVLRFLLEFLTLSHSHKSSSGHGTLF